MVGFFVMMILVTAFTRVNINKFDIKGKNIIALIIGVSFTGFLNLIQVILKWILDLIF